jgi:hypothetical protein
MAAEKGESVRKVIVPVFVSLDGALILTPSRQQMTV